MFNKKKKLIVIFLDGVGYNKDNNKSNIFPYDFINLCGQNCYYFGVNATLNVRGIPQSGTGQVSLLCGINAAEDICKHYGPFPHHYHKEILKNKNIFKVLESNHIVTYFTNAYPHKYFDMLDKYNFQGAFARAYSYTRKKLNTFNELKLKKAISGDITNERWINMNYEIDLISPEEAAHILYNLSDSFDFIVYEYFFTDHIGHGKITGETAANLLNNLKLFLMQVINLVNQKEVNLLICSDHGNIEELDTKLHTYNDALFIAAGREAEYFSTKIKYLYDFYKTILNYFEV